MWLRFLAVVVCVVCGAADAVADQSVPAAERAALIALYNSTGGDNWENKEGWLGAPGTECTEWHNVACTPAQDEVPHIGYIDLSGNHLVGSIPPVIGDLPFLWFLDLSENDLSGPIPPQMGSLGELWNLRLNGNDLTGPIPPELGALSKLKELFLYRNTLSGRIPAELGNLSSLENLWLSENDLTGLIPARLGLLASLIYLKVEKNRLMGPIPHELEDLENLKDSGSDFRYNALYTADDAFADALNEKQRFSSHWRVSQTLTLVLDLDENDRIDLADVVTVMKVLASETPSMRSDAAGAGGRLGLEDALYMLRLISEY